MLAAMTRAAVLLRGINVGGHNRIKMPALVEVLEGIGCTDVVTYVQSGNAVVTSPLAAGALEIEARSALAAYGLDVPVLVRTARQVDAVVAGNPFAGEELDPVMLHAVFVSAEVPADRVPTDEQGDRVRPGPGVLYVAYVGSSHNSKLAPRLTDAKLGVTATARNWKTVLALQSRLKD